MTQKQIGWYRSEWQLVRQTLAKDTSIPKRTTKEWESLRHFLHIAALGKDKSSTMLTNLEWDMVRAEFWKISYPDDLNRQISCKQAAKKRAMYSISKFPRIYLEHLCRDRFGTRDVNQLSDQQIFDLAMTLDNRRESLEDRELRTDEAAGESLDAEEGCNDPEPAFACQTQSDDPF